MKRAEPLPLLTPQQLRILNTSYPFTIQGWTWLSETLRSTLSCAPTSMKLPNTGEVHMMLHPSLQATYTPTTPPHLLFTGHFWLRHGWHGKKQSQQATLTSTSCECGGPPVNKGPPSLPGAQLRLFAPRQSPAQPPDAPTIAATFPDIAARVLCERYCLLPLGFSATFNARGAISLTVIEKATMAASYAP